VQGLSREGEEAAGGDARVTTFWDIPLGTKMPDGWVKTHDHRISLDGWGITIDRGDLPFRFLVYDPKAKLSGACKTLGEAKERVRELRGVKEAQC
jgi:hypothetical protein